jgi:large subunit ribosomal protein L18e
MVKRTGPTNYQLKSLLEDLDKVRLTSNFWKRVIKDLNKPTRQRRVINVYKIDKYAKDGETVLVPGKVLSVGEIAKKVNVAALNFSEDAQKKITEANGKVMSIRELFEKNPEGKNVRILG